MCNEDAAVLSPYLVPSIQMMNKEGRMEGRGISGVRIEIRATRNEGEVECDTDRKQSNTGRREGEGRAEDRKGLRCL